MSGLDIGPRDVNIASISEGVELTVTPATQTTLTNVIGRFLDTNGNGTGTKNANGNYSGAEEIFYIQPPSGQKYKIGSLVISIVDNGAYGYDNYGAMNALTNGIIFRVRNGAGTVLLDITDGIPIKKNAGFTRITSEFYTPKDHIFIRINFVDSFGSSITLDGDNGEKLEAVLNDNFTGVIEHYFYAAGSK